MFDHQHFPSPDVFHHQFLKFLCGSTRLFPLSPSFLHVIAKHIFRLPTSPPSPLPHWSLVTKKQATSLGPLLRTPRQLVVDQESQRSTLTHTHNQVMKNLTGEGMGEFNPVAHGASAEVYTAVIRAWKEYEKGGVGLLLMWVTVMWFFLWTCTDIQIHTKKVGPMFEMLVRWQNFMWTIKAVPSVIQDRDRGFINLNVLCTRFHTTPNRSAVSSNIKMT